MSKTIALPAMQAESNQPILKYLVLFALVVGLMLTMAHAGGDTTEVDDIWDKLSGWATGAPGKIIAMLSFLSAVWFGIVKPNYTNAIGSIVFCLMMANATDIIENFLAMSL